MPLIMSGPPIHSHPHGGKPPAPDSWWGRNWKWIVLSFVTFVFLFIAAVFGLIFFVVVTTMKSNEPYKYAFDQVQHSPAVVRHIGEPVEAGMFVSGQINVNGPTGHADLDFPIFGPKGKARVYVVGDKAEGHWTYRTLEVRFEGDPNRLDLLAEPPPSGNR